MMDSKELSEHLKNDVTNENGLLLQEQEFLDVLFEECQGNIREAMTKAGYAKSVPASVLTRKLQKEIKQRSEDYLIANTPRAAISMVSALNDGNVPGLKNSLMAAKEILDRGGVYKKEDTVKTETKNIFILPAIREADD